MARGKPYSDVYLATLNALGIVSKNALAIEDTALSAVSAKRAGLKVVVTPGALTSDQDLWKADLVLTALGDASQSDPRLLNMMNGNE